MSEDDRTIQITNSGFTTMSKGFASLFAEKARGNSQLQKVGTAMKKKDRMQRDQALS
jgi:hypothetical protein